METKAILFFTILKIRKKSSIYDYTIDDLVVFDYTPADQIKFNIAV